MKKKISFTMFFSSIWREMGKVIGAFGRFFGYKGPESIFRVAGRITAVCFAVLLLIFTAALVYKLCDEAYDTLAYRYRASRCWITRYQLSSQIAYQWNYSKREGRIMNLTTKKVLEDDVDWSIQSDDGDSLAVFAKDGYRGFINRFTGKVVVPPTTYTHAWVFSEGLAAVVKEGRLLFIDHQGKVVIDNGMMADVVGTSYVFHHGYCIVEDSQFNGHWGLMDKEGKWAVEPECESISYVDDGLWLLDMKRKVRILSEDMELLFEADCQTSYVCDEEIFVISDKQEVRKFIPATGQLSDILISEVSKLTYKTDEIQPVQTKTLDGEGHLTGLTYEGETYTVLAYADCYCYSSRRGWFGLMSREGKMITLPMYDSIEAIGRGLYLCTETGGKGVVLNNKGEEVRV